MKKIVRLLLSGLLYFGAGATCLSSLSSCSYDDTAITDRLSDVEDRLTVLESAMEQAQTNINNLQIIVEAMQSDVAVSSVTANEDGSYTLTFSNGLSITIGGDDAIEQPIISVVEEDGNYYWIYVYEDGSKEYIVDEDGNNIQANGEEGIVPLIQINEETDEWEYSIDNGETWVSTGVVATGADGDSFFSGVDCDSSEDYIYITLADGTVLKLAKVKDLVFTLEYSSITDFNYEETREVGVTMSGIYKYSIAKPDGWRVSLSGSTLTVTSPAKDNTYAETEGIVSIVCVGSNGQSIIAELNVSFGEGIDVVNLSAVGTANSYVVGEVGRYKFNATVQGNGAEGATIEGYTFEDYASMAPAGGKILWMTSAGLVTEVAKNGDFIEFTVPEMVSGNALIASVDATGTVLWSWHIWVTDADLEAAAQTYPKAGCEVMDRNLGAFNNTPGDVEAIGLFYQWGRKDPFVGPAAMHASSPGTESATNQLRRTVYDEDGGEIIPFVDQSYVAPTGDGTIGTIAYATANPTTFIAYKNGSDWYEGTGTTAADRNNYLWGNPNGYIRKDVAALHTTDVVSGNYTYQYTDSIKTISHKKTGEFFSYAYASEELAGETYCYESDVVPDFETGKKSIYDPCPVGWRVPHSSVWAGFNYDSDSYYETLPEGYLNTSQFDAVNMGRTFYLGNGETTWYQCTGSLSYKTGAYENYNNSRFWCNDVGSANFTLTFYKAENTIDDVVEEVYEGYYYKYRTDVRTANNAAYIYFNTSSVTSKMIYIPYLLNTDGERKPSAMNTCKVNAQDSNGGAARAIGQAIRCVRE